MEDCAIKMLDVNIVFAVIVKPTVALLPILKFDKGLDWRESENSLACAAILPLIDEAVVIVMLKVPTGGLAIHHISSLDSVLYVLDDEVRKVKEVPP